MELTPTQQRIFNLLSDGQPHTLEELRCCLGENGELASLNDKEWIKRANNVVFVQVTLLRQRIYYRKLSISCNRCGKSPSTYQMVKHIEAPLKVRTGKK